MAFLSPFRLYLMGGAVALAVLAIGYIRWDAARDAKIERELQSERATSNVLRNSVEDTDAVNSLDDDALRDALMRRVPGPR